MKWKAVDFIIAIFAITVSLVILSVLANVVVSQKGLSGERAENFNALLGSLVAIISMYVGAKIQENRDNDKKDKKTL